MVKMKIEYLGDLHCEAVHEPSGAKIATDAPKDNEGKGEAFSPTDLVGAALGSCTVTIMGMVARRHDIDLTGTKIEVEKEMVADPARRIARLGVTLRMPRALPDGQRKLLAKAAESCPVTKSLHPNTKVDLRIEYPS
jgi:putative redox protein